jgi:hypothetical protein
VIDDELEQFAACKEHPDPLAFFEVEEAIDAGRDVDEARLASALVCCTTCVVRAECLDGATRLKSFGVWGGTTAEERGRPYRLAATRKKKKKARRR